MSSNVNFHKDPLGLMSGQVPKDYLKIVQSLIRPDANTSPKMPPEANTSSGNVPHQPKHSHTSSSSVLTSKQQSGRQY